LGEERKQTSAEEPRRATPPEGETWRARKRPSPPPDHQRTEAPARAAARTEETAERKQAPRPPRPKAEKTDTRESAENGRENDRIRPHRAANDETSG